MGKNTMMKRSIRLYCEKTGDEKWQVLLDVLVGNVGLVFTKADLADVRLPTSAPQNTNLISVSSHLSDHLSETA